MDKEYIISGDCPFGTGVLIGIYGRDKESAMRRCEELKSNPEKYADVIRDVFPESLRVKELDRSECWWYDPVLRN